jgi:hypothetical protein
MSIVFKTQRKNNQKQLAGITKYIYKKYFNIKLNKIRSCDGYKHWESKLVRNSLTSPGASQSYNVAQSKLDLLVLEMKVFFFVFIFTVLSILLMCS